jgi:hypothetical protein
MKFFTPDLLIRFGSTDDAIADAAQDEWETAHRQYLDHLREIRSKLPRSVQDFLRRICLHDARLLTLGIREDSGKLLLFLELDTPPDKGVLLTYDLAKRPELVIHPSLSEQGTPVEWLYDEIDVAKGGKPSIFTHSILFTGGRELQLTFRRMRVMLFQKVFGKAAEGNGTELDALWPGGAKVSV